AVSDNGPIGDDNAISDDGPESDSHTVTDDRTVTDYRAITDNRGISDNRAVTDDRTQRIDRLILGDQACAFGPMLAQQDALRPSESVTGDGCLGRGQESGIQQGSPDGFGGAKIRPH